MDAMGAQNNMMDAMGTRNNMMDAIGAQNNMMDAISANLMAAKPKPDGSDEQLNYDGY